MSNQPIKDLWSKYSKVIISIGATAGALLSIIALWTTLQWPIPATSNDIAELREHFDQRIAVVETNIEREFVRKDRMDVIRQRLASMRKALNVLPADATDERSSIRAEIAVLEEELEALEVK